jgi:hypothetical protein
MLANVGDFICFSSDHTVSDRQNAEGILAWKWGITSVLPSGHPYKNVSPNMSIV